MKSPKTKCSCGYDGEVIYRIYVYDWCCPECGQRSIINSDFWKAMEQDE